MQEQGGGGLKLCTGIADPCRKRGDGGLKLYKTPPLSMQKVLITILRFFFFYPSLILGIANFLILILLFFFLPLKITLRLMWSHLVVAHASLDVDIVQPKTENGNKLVCF